MVARITGVSSRLDLAEAAAETVLSSPSTSLQFARQARAGLALLAVLRNADLLAAEQYAALESARGTTLAGVGLVADHLLGLLSRSMDNLDQAMDHFEDAMAFCRRAGYRPELAWTCCDYANALLRRRSTGDLGKAMSLLDESLAISSELGMRPLMERVAARRLGMSVQALWVRRNPVRVPPI